MPTCTGPTTTTATTTTTDAPRATLEGVLIAKMGDLLGDEQLVTSAPGKSSAAFCAGVEFFWMNRDLTRALGTTYGLASNPEYATIPTEQRRQCCLDVEVPSASNSQSHVRHSVTTRHISSLYGVGVPALKAALGAVFDNIEATRAIFRVELPEQADLLRLARRVHVRATEVNA